MALLLGLIVGVAEGCGSDTVGPDLGPTAGPEHGGLRIEVSFPISVRSGQAVVFYVTLSNVGAAPLMASPQVDVFVLARDGELLWNFMYGAAEIGPEFVLLPGEAFEADLVWDQTVNGAGVVVPGTYTVFAAYYPTSPPVLVSEVGAMTIERD